MNRRELRKKKKEEEKIFVDLLKMKLRGRFSSKGREKIVQSIARCVLDILIVPGDVLSPSKAAEICTHLLELENLYELINKRSGENE